MQYGLQGLVNTASGWDLEIKKLEFWGEVMAGFSVTVSHGVIWFYAPRGA